MENADNVDAHPDKVGGGDDSIDAKFSGMSLGGASARAAAVDDETKYRYSMEHHKRGRMIIINNRTFYPQTGMNERGGTDKDAASLYTDFNQLGFSVQLVHNRTADQMLQLMISAAGENHADRDCFAVAVLSHGDDGVLYGVDKTITIENFIAPIKSCPSLVGKPKLFIFQACRGNELDSGVEVADATGEPAPAQRIPIEADFLYAYSTTPGYFSWRNSAKGSWFVQALHRMIEKYGAKLDFVSLLTRVNYEVAYEFESNAAQAHMTRKKQVPSIVSMLTKELYFTRKSK